MLYQVGPRGRDVLRAPLRTPEPALSRSPYCCGVPDHGSRRPGRTDGGEVFMPVQETFFATRFAQLRDRFGMNWMIVHQRS